MSRTREGEGLWWIAAAINTVLAAIVVCQKKGRVPTPTQRKNTTLWLLYTPALIIFGICAYLLCKSCLTRRLAFLISHFDISQLLVITWVPLVEEITYRQGLSAWCQKLLKTDTLWGSYFSALFFASLHVLAITHVELTWIPPLILGPFIFAVSAEFLYRYGGRIFPCILFHGSCNMCALLLTL